ncbi:MAG: hypothetical protein IJH54_04115 [Clostridia bacterium]|nr:hypothetical protein [Clostridia bacterium]
MNINDLSLGVVEKNNPKALHERMEKCKKEAKEVLSLSSCDGRPIKAGDSIFMWNVQYQMWYLQIPSKRFTNWLPTAVAAESLAWELYSGEEWNWYYL